MVFKPSYEELKRRNRNEIIDPFERDADGRTILQGEERRNAQKSAFFADVFITGANAVTLDGKIVSTDAVGNRVAPIIFGPEKVILVIGANKIVNDIEGAHRRVHEVAAPINAKRHALKHHNLEFGKLPCAVAFSIAKKLKVSPRQVGDAANELRIKIATCQLGCFP